MTRDKGAMRPTHCLAFEIEEHFHVPAFDSPLCRRHWDGFESRVDRNTDKLLEFLSDRNTRATFFVLGWVAERHRDLVRTLGKQGHEVASRGYASELVTAQTADQFRQDVRKAKQVLEDLLGEPVLGYRAPHLSISDETAWALPTLAEEGYLYDSSLRCGSGRGRVALNPGALYHRMATAGGALWEVPPSVLSVAGLPVRTADGAYFRLLPYGLFRRAALRAERRGRTLLLSLAAWELDAAQPRMSGLMCSRKLARARHYANLDKTEARLQSLLRDFWFTPIRAAIPALQGADRAAKTAG